MDAEDVSAMTDATAAQLTAAVRAAVALAQEALSMAKEVKAAQSTHEQICAMRQEQIARQFVAVLDKQEGMTERLDYIGALGAKTLLSASGGLVFAVVGLLWALLKNGGVIH